MIDDFFDTLIVRKVFMVLTGSLIDAAVIEYMMDMGDATDGSYFPYDRQKWSENLYLKPEEVGRSADHLRRQPFWEEVDAFDIDRTITFVRINKRVLLDHLKEMKVI